MDAEMDRLNAERMEERRKEARDEYRKGICWGREVERLLLERKLTLEDEVHFAQARLEELR
jgi:hypothetical protein